MKNLPHFTIRESAKAKRVILKVSDRHGLEVVIPSGFSHHRVTQIIQEKREWIEQAIRKINHSKSIPKQPRKLPDTIFLKAVNLAFEVEYVPVAIPLLELKHLSPASIRISGDLKDSLGCQDLLKRWLQHQGRLHLIPWLEQVSSETGLAFQKVQIRGQKSRWGSCSSGKTVCLNYNLLFLRPELVRYLIIHELCHTIHMNHSAKFYQFFAKLVPDYQKLRAEIKQARDLVPWWALPG
jgi:predicted metal-dependent hydrolase